MKQIKPNKVRAVIFLSRFAFICNIAFLLYIFFRWMEIKSPAKAAADRVMALPFLKELIIILGFSAIIINAAMIIVYLFYVISGTIKVLPRWLVFINILFFLVQIFYFFLS